MIKKLFYLMLLLCTNFITPAAYNPDEKRSNALQSQTDQTEQDERKKRETSKIIYIQSSIGYDSHESLPVEMKIAKNQSRTLNELITLDQEQDIDPTSKVYQFSLFDTQTLKDIINLMTIAEQQPEEIDNEIKKIMTVTEKQPEEIDDKIKNIMTATEKNPQEIDNKVNIFALLYAADFFQASDAIKAALIKHLFTQVDNPEDHNAIIELLNLNELLSPTIVRNYMPYIAKQYFLRYDKMPEEWKKFHFELSVRELPEHKKQVTKMYIIWGGRSLMLLNLSGNFLTSLDGLKDIPNIEEVENLDISNNNINNFEYMPLLPNLWDLDISNNNISSWKYMPLLPNLLNLNVSNNNISSWEYMPLFPNLVDLDVSKNNISSWEYIPLFPNLEELDMSKNNISSWEYIPLFPNLMDLNVSKNNISSFEHMPPDLAIIEIKENNLSEEEKKRAQEMFPEILFYF